MSIIYRPTGRAGEYSEYAVNLFGGCDHLCAYYFSPLARHVDRKTFYAAGATPYQDVLKKLAADCRRLQGTITTPIMLSFTEKITT